jgi:predicted AlkP superfamily pyrophosphatase or phosphodiesterase
VRPRRAALLLLLALAGGIVRPAAPRAQQDRPGGPILVLVSLDGWRWDYLDRVKAPNLRALAARGVRARALIPVFPTLTFPNHYTIVTGLYPARHGIVANTFTDPAFPERFTMSAATARDARWWGGEPVWVTAIRQGRLAGAMFWPGAEVAINGVRPTYWQPFDDAYPNQDRIDKVLGWLALPAGQQPSMITLYFSDVDHAGHDHGPDSHELEQAAARLDAALGRLVDGVRAQRLESRVNFVVVSDHGMTPASDERLVFLDDYVDLSTIDVVNWESLLQIVPRPGATDSVYRRLRGRVPHLTIFRKHEIPRRLHYRSNPRIPPIVGIPDAGWNVTSRARQQRRTDDRLRPRAGAHGYDPDAPDMHGLFVAAGPAIRSGILADAFENIHIYEFLCAILRLTPAKNDGDPAVTRRFLAN